jgi:multiple sugar transport system substrate-binding protein
MLKDPNLTDPNFDAADFVAGTMAPMTGAKGEICGFPWEAGAMLMAIARSDLLDQAGAKTPTTFDELTAVCKAVNGKDGAAAFVNDRLHHWHYPSFLMGFGGNVFKAPPGDLTPTLDTAEAADAAEYYATLLSEFGPSGVLSFTDDQALRAQLAGRANIRTQAVLWVSPLATHPESKVAKTVHYALMPAGPKGSFPGSNSHGLGIPAGAKNKEAAWAFIQWALSKELLTRMVNEKGYSAVCRRSLIESPIYKTRMTLNGQDVASLYLQVLELGGASGYMKYRTVPVFPQVGDKINKAIERIATRQQDARAAMRQAQGEAIADLKKAGFL